jgi:predicted alpha/beta hydrolase
MPTQQCATSPNSRELSPVIHRDLVIHATDGVPLAARLWSPEPSAVGQYVAIVNSGAGIAYSYYERFAAYLAANRIPTVLYDYRGIAKSRPRSLAGFEACVEEWGSKDCAAVLDWVAGTFPGAKRLVIGHSVGGFLTGFAPNGGLIDRMLLVSAHTGYWGDYATPARFPMFLLWHAIMPVLTHLLGYFPGRSLHLMEDLPKGVALDWARRRKPDFWWRLNLPDGSPDYALIGALLKRFHAISGHTLALRFQDDPFATREATNRVLGLYANVPAAELTIGPGDVGGQKIGHFGFFRSRFRSTLWPEVVIWLENPDRYQVCNHTAIACDN